MFFKTYDILRMTIDGYNNGDVGIHCTPITGFPLTVYNDINCSLNVLHHGYWIGNELVLSAPATDNTFIGVNTGWSLTTGKENLFVGKDAGFNNTTGDQNVFLGAGAGENNTSAVANVFVGAYAGQYNQTGHDNTYIGNLSGFTNTSANSNTYLGQHSGAYNTGSQNTFLGYHAGFLGGSGGENVAVGESALTSIYSANAIQNTIVGTRAGYNLDEGATNTFLGYRSGVNNRTGNGNVFIGDHSGQFNNVGNYNICIGKEANCGTSLSNATAMGYQAEVKNSNQMIIGNNVNVGLGLSGNTTGPRSKLEIKSGTSNGSGLQFTDLTSSYSPGSTATKFLTVDGTGIVVLKDAPGGSGDVSYCGSTASD